MTVDVPHRADQAERHPHTVEIRVNRAPVEVPDREVTGLEIKKAAIEQHVEIGLTFQLSVRHGGHYRVIGDTDTIRVHEHEEFIAVDRDDNS